MQRLKQHDTIYIITTPSCQQILEEEETALQLVRKAFIFA